MHRDIWYRQYYYLYKSKKGTKKMKKRVLAGLLMSVMVLASAMSVSAADSKTKPVEGGKTEDGNGSYVVTTENPVFEELTDAAIDANEKVTDKAAAKASAKAAAATIEKINKGEKASITTEVDKKIEGKTLVQKFFDLDETGDHNKCHQPGNKHKVTLTVDALTTGWKNIVVVHYSTDRVLWETIPVADKDVDYTKKTITFEIEDLSPIAIYADVVTGGAAGTSPSTEGVSSAWMLYAAMALIVLGSGVVVYQKKRG